MKIALYCRVSTTDQSCAAQLMELRAFAAAKGWTVAREFTDVISGSKSERTGMDELMTLVRARSMEAVLAVKIDRMARSLAHFARLAEEFIRSDVALILTSQGIDTSKSNPCGRFQMNVLAAVAEFERDLIRERTRAGLAVARASGKVLGRPSTKLPASGVARRAIVGQWRNDGGKDYRELGVRLGGVSGSTAWRLAQKYSPAKQDGNGSAKKPLVTLDVE